MQRLPYDEPDLPPFAPPPHAGACDTNSEFETICAHFAEDRNALGGGASVPIFQSSTFVYPRMADFDARKSGDSNFWEYTRVGNPTTAILQAKLAALEKGNWSFAMPSGMSAISAALNACLSAGDHVVALERCYWPLTRYLRNYLPRFGVTATLAAEATADAVIATIQPNTKVIYLESPTSGTFDVLDLDPIIAVGKERGIATIFDNSWASPCFFNPLEHGIDMVVHSATKYIGGHSDVVAGVVVGRDEIWKRRVFREVELVGGTIDPFASWLLLRGLRTLGLRMERMRDNALAVARLLENHEKVRRVRHPGLESHPHYELVQKYFTGTGSLFSFELTDQSKAAAFAFVDALKLFSIGVSWGGHESLALAGEYFSDPNDPAWAIRLHCGLESENDLLRDVEQALANV
ncbi:MAG: PLP-dependent aspartate aminotransferase family protein [Phycisphaerae bacterium]